jgi:hypothetical protein
LQGHVWKVRVSLIEYMVVCLLFNMSKKCGSWEESTLSHKHHRYAFKKAKSAA